MNTLRMLVAQAALLSVGSVSAQHAAPPGDFAIKLEFGLCSTDVIDTFDGIYVRDLGHGQKVPAQVSASSEEMDQLYAAMSAAKFFEFPADFKPHVDGITEPTPHYRLTVRAGGTTHTVSWTDWGWGSPRTSPPEAQRLRELLDKIIKTYSELPAVQNLPHSEMICV
jgi:hypothetical protein